MVRVMALILLGVLSAGLSGCWFNQGPDDSAVRQIVQDQLDPSATVLMVSRIASLNAVEQAQGRWLVDVSAVVSFKQSAQAMAKTLEGGNPVAGFMGKLGQIGLMLQFGNFKAGETAPYQTRLVLLNGSAGWMLADR